MRVVRFFISIFILSLSVTPVLFAGEDESPWTDELYSKTDNTAFFALERTGLKIDFEKPDRELLDAAVFYETNRRRLENGLTELAYLPALRKAARLHASDMVKYNYFSHESPVKGFQTLSDRLQRQGIVLGYKGENIARGFGIEYQSGKAVFPPNVTHSGFRYKLDGSDLEARTYRRLAEVIVDQFMNSPDHRANILNSDYRYLGCAVVPYKATNFYNMDYVMVVQNFSSDPGSPDG